MNDLDKARFDLDMILPYVDFLRRKATLPTGNSLCYPNEIGGHGQIDEIPQDQEISQFPQAKVIYEPAKEIHNEYPTQLYEKLKLKGLRAELKSIIERRSGGKRKS